MPNGAIGVKHRGGADEAAPVGVVVAGVEVVHTRFGIKVITAITERIVLPQSVRHRPRDADVATPSIVGIADNQRARGIKDSQNVAEDVFIIVIILPVPVQPDGGTVLVVVIIELMGYGAVFVLAGFCDDGAAVQDVVHRIRNHARILNNLIGAARRVPGTSTLCNLR